MSPRPLTPGILIRQARALLGLSRRQMAVALDMSERTLSEYETEFATPRRVTMMAIEALMRRAGRTADADAFGNRCGTR